MEQDSNESGLKNLNVLKYWKYVLKRKTRNGLVTCVITKQNNNSLLREIPLWEKYIQLGTFEGGEPESMGPTTFIPREILTDQNGGEFWSRVDYLYCDKQDDLQYLAGACGVVCIFSKEELLNKAKGKTKPEPIDRVNAFENVKNLLT